MLDKLILCDSNRFATITINNNHVVLKTKQIIRECQVCIRRLLAPILTIRIESYKSMESTVSNVYRERKITTIESHTNKAFGSHLYESFF